MKKFLTVLAVLAAIAIAIVATQPGMVDKIKGLFSKSDNVTTVQVTATPQPKATATPTLKATEKPKASATPTLKATEKPKASATPTLKATKKPKASATSKPTATPKPKNTATPRPTATPKPKNTATPRPTATPTPKPTRKPTPTPTPKPTATPTPKPTTKPTATPYAPKEITDYRVKRVQAELEKTVVGRNILPDTKSRPTYDFMVLGISIDGYDVDEMLYVLKKFSSIYYENFAMTIPANGTPEEKLDAALKSAVGKNGRLVTTNSKGNGKELEALIDQVKDKKKTCDIILQFITDYTVRNPQNLAERKFLCE